MHIYNISYNTDKFILLVFGAELDLYWKYL
jgi:hypothetical protein